MSANSPLALMKGIKREGDTHESLGLLIEVHEIRTGAARNSRPSSATQSQGGERSSLSATTNASSPTAPAAATAPARPSSAPASVERSLEPAATAVSSSATVVTTGKPQPSQDQAATKIQSLQRQRVAKKEVDTRRAAVREREQAPIAQVRAAATTDDINTRTATISTGKARPSQDEAATKIQSLQRQRIAKKEVETMRHELARQTTALPYPDPCDTSMTTMPMHSGSSLAVPSTEFRMHTLSPNLMPAAPPTTPAVIGHHAPTPVNANDPPTPVQFSTPLPPAATNVSRQQEMLRMNSLEEVKQLQDESAATAPQIQVQQNQQQQQQQEEVPGQQEQGTVVPVSEEEEEKEVPEDHSPYSPRTKFVSTARMGQRLCGELKGLQPAPPKSSRPAEAGRPTKSINVGGQHVSAILAAEEVKNGAASPSPHRSRAFVARAAEISKMSVVSPGAPRMSDLPDDSVDRANALIERANRLTARASQHSECDWNEVRELFFRAGTLFQDAGMHTEAGAAFSNAASVSHAVGDAQEVASAASFAVDSLRESDPSGAVENLHKLIEAYEKSGNRLLMAREARQLAELYENTMGDREAAMKYYTVANEVYAERCTGTGRDSSTKSLYIATLRSMVFLAVELGQHKYAQSLAETLTKQQPQWRTQWYMLACLCTIAEGNDPEKNPTSVIARAVRTFSSYQDNERAFQSGFEHDLIKGIFAAWGQGAVQTAPSLAVFDRAQQHFETGRGIQAEIAEKKGDRLAASFAVLLETCRENLFNFMLPYL